GMAGIVRLPQLDLTGLALTASGTIVVGGMTATAAVVERFRANGAADASFGDGGRIDLPPLPPSAPALAVDAAGRITVTRAFASPSSFEVIDRYTAGGVLDVSFGSSGEARVDGFVGKVIAFDPQGRTLIAGSQALTGMRPVPGVLRLLGNGGPDPGFGTA